MSDEGLAAGFNAAPTDIASYYETWAGSGNYDDDVAGWGYDAPERVASMALEQLRQLPGDVLDAGCGTGRVGAALAAIGIGDITGGDFTASSVEAARKRGVYQAVDHLDLNAPLPFMNDRFAAVVSVGVFSYLADTEATLRELLRITTPGGAVIFTQRTDLWQRRDCGAIIETLVDDNMCSASVSGQQPYLPLHPEFTDDISIMYSTLIKSS